MAVRTVRIYGDPVLREKAKPVVEFDDSLRTLVADMFDTMKHYDGCGLAANQVGVAQRVFVVLYADESGQPVRRVCVNPVLDRFDGKERDAEGCLSLPGLQDTVERPQRVRVRAQDEHGQAWEETFTGYLARVFLHENDHLDGVLFIDRLSVLKRQLHRRDLDAFTRGEVPPGYHPEKSHEGEL